MSSKTRYLTSPLTAAIAAALYPGPEAAAQEQEQEGERILEEVIVTATRREVSLQDLPQSVQAFTNEDIIRNAFTNFNDVANAIPSMTLIQDMPGRNSVKFRGSSTGTGEYYTASTAAIYFDETPLTFNSQQLWPAMVDIARIEALPGPQGTVFGSSSLAGTIRVITNPPDPNEFSGEVYGEYFATDGGSGSWAMSGHINIPLISDTLALRLVAHHRDEGGWIDNVFGKAFVRPNQNRFSSSPNNRHLLENDWNDYSLSGGRAALLWNINDNWRTVVSLITENNEADGSWGEDTSLGDDEVALFHKEFRDDEWWNASLLITGDLGFASLVSSTTYLDREIVYEWENMVYEQWKDSFWGVYYGFVLYNTEYTYGWIFNDQTQDRFSQEIRLTSTSDSRFQWMVGGFYEDINDQWYFGAANPDLLDTVHWYYANYWAYYYNYYGYPVEYPIAPTIVGYSNTLDRTFEQLAFFGEVSYQITDDLTVTAGARWFQFDWDDFKQNQFPEGFPPWGMMDTDGAYISSSSTDDTAFKFSLDYHVNDSVMVYGLFSQGFRNGGENSLRAARSGLIPLEFGPDFMDNYELGMKSSFLGNRMQLNVTYFNMEWTDRQFNESAGVWYLNGNVNAGDTEQEGIELDLAWQATDDLRIEANVTWLDAQAKTRFRFPSGLIIRPGDDLPNAPDLGYWVAVDYTFPWRPFDGVLWGRIDYAFQDEWWDGTSGAIEQDPKDLIPDWNNTNLQVGLALPDNWTITAFVNNLTNEERTNSRQDNSYASDWFGTSSHRLIEFQARPRHYGMSVRKAFR